jgi:hypothetical protein
MVISAMCCMFNHCITVCSLLTLLPICTHIYHFPPKFTLTDTQQYPVRCQLSYVFSLYSLHQSFPFHSILNAICSQVPVSHLLGGSSLARYYIRFKLIDVTTVNDFTILPQSFTGSLFDIDTPAPTSTFIVSGIQPSLSLYTIGGKQQFQHLGKLASYVKDRVGSALSKTVGSALVSFFGSGSGGGNSTMHETSDEDEYTAISSVLDFEESDKRTILRLSVSPGELCER